MFNIDRIRRAHMCVNIIEKDGRLGNNDYLSQTKYTEVMLLKVYNVM